MGNEKDLLTFLTEYLTENRKKKLREVLNFRTRHLAVVLENIYQPHNASAIVRTCDCYGVQDLHVIENDNEYVINPKVVMGAGKWVSLYKYHEAENNTLDCVTKLKEQGYKIVVTSPHAAQYTPIDLPIEDKLALCFGTEKEGASEQLQEQADYFMRIPMYGFTESFNVSVSASLCISRLIERLHQSSISWQLSPEELLSLTLDWTTKSIRNGARLRDNFLKGLHHSSKGLNE